MSDQDTIEEETETEQDHAEELANIIKIRAPQDSRLALAQSKANRWFLEAEEGTPFLAVLASSYWCHISPKLREWDEVRIAAEADGWYAELIVLSKVPHGAIVIPKPGYPMQLGDDAVLPTFKDKYLVEFKGFAKWRVVRLVDKKVIKDKLASKTDANKWLVENQRMLLG